MAYYLAMDIDLPDKPQFVQISDQTGLPDETICGILYLFWRWVNAVGEPHPSREGFGILPGCTHQSAIKKAGGDQTFWRAVEVAEWAWFKPEGIVIPGWGERFSPEAKQRWSDKVRKQEQRRSMSNAGYMVNATAEPEQARKKPSRNYEKTPSVFEDLTTQLLADTPYLMSWVTIAAKQRNPVVMDDDYHRQRTLAAARYCLTAPSVRNPPALFARMHLNNLWTGLSEKYWAYGKSQFAQWAGKSTPKKTGHPDLDQADDDEPTPLGTMFREQILNRGRN